VLIRPDDTPGELWRRELFPLGVRLFDRVLGSGWNVEDEVPQDEALATWEPSWDRAPLRRPDLLLLGDGHTEAPRARGIAPGRVALGQGHNGAPDLESAP
jgi:hypothetical protein